MTMLKRKTERKSLTFPVPMSDGTEKAYTVFSPPGPVGIAVQQVVGIMYSASQDVNQSIDPERDTPELNAIMTDDDPRSLMVRAMGGVYEEMIADGVDSHFLSLAQQTVQVWLIEGEKSAAEFWATDGERPGKARRPQDRKKKAKK